jgi:hypothetical protein
MKTNRQVLIEAGVPADELDRIGCEHKLDEAADTEFYDFLDNCFVWYKSLQGHDFRRAIHERLKCGQPISPPKPEPDWKVMAERLAEVLALAKLALNGDFKDFDLVDRCVSEVLDDFIKMVEGSNESDSAG